MAHGRMSRSTARYPDSKRRADRYGNTRYGKRRRVLPPQLMPAITGRNTKSQFLGGPVVILSVLGVITAVAAIVFIIITAITAAIGVAGTMAAYRDVNEDLPNAAEIATNTFQTTSIYDRNGVLLQEVENPNYGWRTYVPMEQMTDDFVNATISAEDATFWTNAGVEPYAIARGVFINVSGAGSSGGSTITQQLVRAIYPDQINAMDISYTRKGREALAAYALAQEYSKSDIFTMYVNQIFYGNRAYGVEAAANVYFGKHASELTLAESTYLAGMPQSPSYYAEFFDQAKIRQEYVLDQMVKYRYITRAEADAAFAEPLNFAESDRTSQVKAAPHFTEYVRQYVIENYGEEALYGGLEITTSIDVELQDRAEQIVAQGVAEASQAGRNNGAMIVMVPWSGEILAMVGSADFGNALINGEVNYTTALIQPGSSMKPIAYAAAFEDGWNPGTVIMDIPTQWETPGEEPYEPNNYSGRFNGAVTVREALATSLNIPAVKATEWVGVQGVMDTAAAMGLVDSLEEDAGYYGLSIGLGAAEVQLLEHTNAYATLANNGTYVPPHPIIEIKDSQGNILFNLDEAQVAEDASQGVTPGNAYQVTSILTDNDARTPVFGRDNRFGNTQSELGRPVAAKSGTTDDWKDLWTMGYATDVAIGVWVGTSGGVAAATTEVDGIQAAGPIWQRMMLEMHTNSTFAGLLLGPDGQPVPEEFAVPDGAYEGEICAVTGQKPGSGSTTEEWLVEGQGPTRDCTDLDEWERGQLDDAIAATRASNSRWNDGAIESIARYASAIGVTGVQVPQDEEEPEDNSGEGDSPFIEPAAGNESAPPPVIVEEEPPVSSGDESSGDPPVTEPTAPMIEPAD